MQLPNADLIIGTSAGSQLGAEIALGILDLKNPPVPPAFYSNSSYKPSDAFTNLYSDLAEALESSEPEKVRAKIGKKAIESETMSEEQAIQRVDRLNGYDWPKNFKATAVSATTGIFSLWDKDSNIELKKGVASSRALPGVFPPVTINNDRYVDGGVKSMINADAAVGNDGVIVFSCFSLEVSGNNITEDILNKGLLSEIYFLRKNNSEVTVITPDEAFLKLTKNGTDMLNISLIPEAWNIGRKQAINEIKNISSHWLSKF